MAAGHLLNTKNKPIIISKIKRKGKKMSVESKNSSASFGI
jgi:hypothetical protein